MDAKLLDRLSQAVGGRRQALAVMLAGATSSALSVTQPAAGKRHKHKHKKKKGHRYSDYSCSLGELCKGGKCKPGCDPRRVAECPTGMQCNLANGRCAPQCEPDYTCTQEGLICHGGWCAPPCHSDAECDSDRWGGYGAVCDPEHHWCIRY